MAPGGRLADTRREAADGVPRPWPEVQPTPAGQTRLFRRLSLISEDGQADFSQRESLQITDLVKHGLHP